MRNGPLPVWVSVATLAGAVPAAPGQTPVLRGSAGAAAPAVKPQPSRGVSVSESYLAGDYEQVVARLEQVAAGRRLDGREWLLKGAALMRLGRSSDARAAFLRAEAEDPGDLSVALCLVEAEIVEGDFEGARAQLRRPLASRDDSVREYAQFLEVLLHIRESKIERAGALAEAMRWPARTPARLYAQAATALASERPERAEALRREAREVFGPRAALAFDDTLVSMGWMRPSLQPGGPD